MEERLEFNYIFYELANTPGKNPWHVSKKHEESILDGSKLFNIIAKKLYTLLPTLYQRFQTLSCAPIVCFLSASLQHLQNVCLKR